MDQTKVVVDEELVQLERDGWQALVEGGGTGADFYERVMADDGVMLLPGVGLLDKAGAVEGIRQALPWSWFEIQDARVIHVADDVAVVAYAVQAQRDSQPVYEALMSSTYARRGGAWRLALHQQTPLPAQPA